MTNGGANVENTVRRAIEDAREEILTEVHSTVARVFDRLLIRLGLPSAKNELNNNNLDHQECGKNNNNFDHQSYTRAPPKGIHDYHFIHQQNPPTTTSIDDNDNIKHSTPIKSRSSKLARIVPPLHPHFDPMNDKQNCSSPVMNLEESNQHTQVISGISFQLLSLYTNSI